MFSANLRRLRAGPERISSDIGKVPRREVTPGAGVDVLIDRIIGTAKGRLAATEVLDRREPLWTNLYRSA